MFPRRSEGNESEYPFFEGDGSSSDEWRNYGMAGDDYKGPPVFDDDQYEKESMPVYDTDIEDVIEEEEGFVERGGFYGEEDNIEDVVVVANDLCDNLLSWFAKRQHTISRSSAEAEYRGVANVVAETAWIRNLLRELHSPLLTATLVYCDNVIVLYMSANPVQHQRTKHIEIDIHFVRDMVKAGHVRVLHVPSRFQYADIFTKGLPSALFEDFRSSLSVWPPPAPTTGAY
ncbi:ribonuclease H-like domain-containing protein [Tanacetum coccineum]